MVDERDGRSKSDAFASTNDSNLISFSFINIDDIRFNTVFEKKYTLIKSESEDGSFETVSIINFYIMYFECGLQKFQPIH